MHNSGSSTQCPLLIFFRQVQKATHLGRFCLWGLFFVLWAHPLQALKNEGSGDDASERSILLIESSHDRALGFENLRVALEAHLGSNRIDVRLYRIDKLPRRSAAQITTVREIAQKLKISAVIWIDIPKKLMWLLFTDQEGHERLLKRKFTCISHSMQGCVDAIGSKVTSALSSWIGMKSSPVNPSLKTTGESTSADPITDNELNPIAVGSASWEEPLPLVRLFLDVGYGFSFFRGTRGYLHGMRLGIGTVWLEHVKLEISTDIVVPIKSPADDFSTRTEINRWPIRMLVGGVLPHKNWSFALALGLAVDWMNYREASSDLSFDGVDLTNWGFTTSLTVRHFFGEWFALWLELGLDVYGSEFDSAKHGDSDVYQNGVPMNCSPLLFSVAIGVAWGWEFFRSSPE